MIWIIIGMIALASAAYGIYRAWRWVRGLLDAIGRAEEGDGW